MNEIDTFEALTKMAANSRPTTDKIKDWKDYTKKLPWCGGDYCETEQQLDASIKRLAELGLSLYTTVVQKHSGAITALGHMLSVIDQRCDHYDNESLLKLIAKSCDAHGCAIQAGPDTPKRLQKLPPVYYNQQRKEYWHQHESRFYVIDKDSVKTLLVNSGYSPKRGDDLSSSEVENALLQIIHEQSVDTAGRFAGYSVGIHEENGLHILATKSFKLVEPIYPGTPEYERTKCETIFALLDGMFGQNVAANHVAAYIRQGYLDLKAGRKQGGLCMVVIGPVNCGKSLFAAHVLVPLLGGTSGDAGQYMSSATTFNDTLIGAETWLLDDSNPFASYEARMAFTDAVKSACAANTVFCHGKGKAGLSLPLFRRLVVLANDDALESAPDIAGSMSDKVMLVKASKFTMPKDMVQFPDRNDTDDYEKFAEQIKKELPCFLGCILNDPEIGKLCGGRFGVEAWQDPQLVAYMESVSPINDQMTMVFTSLFGRSSELGDSVEVTSTQIWDACHSKQEFKTMTEKFWRTPSKVGQSMTRAMTHPLWKKAVEHRTLDGVSRYELTMTRGISDALGARKRGHLDIEV